MYTSIYFGQKYTFVLYFHTVVMIEKHTVRDEYDVMREMKGDLIEMALETVRAEMKKVRTCFFFLHFTLCDVRDAVDFNRSLHLLHRY